MCNVGGFSHAADDEFSTRLLGGQDCGDCEGEVALREGVGQVDFVNVG